MNRNKKLANMAMLVALAMIFSYVESLIPINFGVPGMKLGVANLVTVTGLYFLEIPEVLAVSVLRVLLTGFFFWKWNVDHLQSGRGGCQPSCHGTCKEDGWNFHCRSQYHWRRLS